MNIKDLDQSDADKKMLQEFADNGRGFMLISGTNGTGKSTAAMAIYEAVTPFRLPQYDHDRAVFISQMELNTWWNGWISKYGDTNGLLKKLQKTKLLVLDDLGTRTPSEAFGDFLYGIVDYRYNNRNKCRTVITTNLGSVDMRQKFNDAFFSRTASGKCLRWDGSDRRFNPKYA